MQERSVVYFENAWEIKKYMREITNSLHAANTIYLQTNAIGGSFCEHIALNDCSLGEYNKSIVRGNNCK